ncbi:MAG: cellulase family glycosylhydrolase [Candidatus Sigynarchaeota archaeon]
MTPERDTLDAANVMKTTFFIVMFAAIASITAITTEYTAVTTPAPEFVWNGVPFRPIGFNYYPCMHPWTGTWEQFNATELARDMALVKQLGGNCIRTFIQWPLVEPSLGVFNMTIVSRVEQFFQVCSNANVAVMFSFFDFGAPAWAGLNETTQDEMYTSPALIAREVAQLQLFIPLLKDYNCSFIWDLRNEPSSTRVTSTQFAVWVQNLTTTIRAMDSEHYIVVGGAYGNFEDPWSYAPDVDAVCMHFYRARTEPQWKREFDAYVKQFDATGKPVIVQEFGWPTYEPLGITEEIQADFYRAMLELCDAHGIDGIMAWCLWEFPTVTWNLSERDFGVLRPDGSWKPAAQVFHDYATGQRQATWNINGWGALF